MWPWPLPLHLFSISGVLMVLSANLNAPRPAFRTQVGKLLTFVGLLSAPSHMCVAGLGLQAGSSGGSQACLGLGSGSGSPGLSGSGSLRPWGEHWLPASSSQEEEDGIVCVSVRSNSGTAAGLLWSQRPQEGLWPRGSAFYGAADRTQLAAVVTHTPQRWPKPCAPLPPPLTAPRHRGPGWIWGWGAALGLGTLIRVTFPGCPLPPVPPRAAVSFLAHGAVPSPRQTDRQTATAGLPLPARQEGTAGLLLPRHVPRLRPGAVPEELGQSPACPSPRLSGTAGSLGLNPPPKCRDFWVSPGPWGGRQGPGGAAGSQAASCPPQRSAVGGRDGSGAGGGTRATPARPKVKSAAHGAAGDVVPEGGGCAGLGEEEEEEEDGALCPPYFSQGRGSVLAPPVGVGLSRGGEGSWGGGAAAGVGAALPSSSSSVSSLRCWPSVSQNKLPGMTSALRFGEGTRQR